MALPWLLLSMLLHPAFEVPRLLQPPPLGAGPPVGCKTDMQKFNCHPWCPLAYIHHKLVDVLETYPLRSGPTWFLRAVSPTAHIVNLTLSCSQQASDFDDGHTCGQLASFSNHHIHDRLQASATLTIKTNPFVSIRNPKDV